MRKEVAMSSDLTAEKLKQLLPEIEMISDKLLIEKVINVWIETWKHSEFEELEDVPYAVSIGGGLDYNAVKHLRTTALSAVAVAKILKEMHGVEVNLDYLVAGALLHDVSKLVEFSARGGKTPLGQKISHSVYGIAAALSQDLPLEVVHIIASHTPQLKKVPESAEAIIIRHLDMLEADCHAFLAGEELYSNRSL